MTKPCLHTGWMIHRRIDHDLKGFWSAYLEYHLSGCPRCREALAALLKLKADLQNVANRETPKLAPDRWAALEAEWDKVDKD